MHPDIVRQMKQQHLDDLLQEARHREKLNLARNGELKDEIAESRGANKRRSWLGELIHRPRPVQPAS